jgi:glucan-binding YG repeat protein
MRVKKINLKKIISYLLIFSVFFTCMQMGSLKKANAAAVTQVTGMIFHIGDASGTEKIVDKDATGAYVADNLELGKTFTLEPATGYNITSVTSSNSSKMSINTQTTTAGNLYIISSITDYSDFTLTVVIKDSSGNSVTYPIKMKFASDSDLEFSKLSIAYDSQTPFTVDYSQTDSNGDYVLGPVDSSVSKATIKMLDASGTQMTCTINGSSNNVVTLAGGQNTITITRTYLGISKDYTLIISKKGVARLQSLVPSAGTLSPAFASDTYDYTMTVPTTQTTIAFTPTSVDSDSTIKVNGSTVKSGNKSKAFNLDEGDNEISIIVTTSEGDTNTYTVTVTRTAQFRSSQLTGLTLTSGTLTPTFNKGIYQYTAIVDNSVTSVGVTPTAEDVNATITINGTTVPSGATSPNISLDEGGNVIDVVVTDTKGNTNTYILNVTRRYPKDNVNLSSLSVTDGTMSPVFDPETYLYSVKVARNIEKVKVSYTSQNDKSTIKINGKTYTNGQSDYINLDIGANLVNVDVIAEDGKTTTTYKLSIIRGDVEGTDQWVLVAGEWTFYNAAGIQVKNDWVKYDNKWYFMDINGYMQTGWINQNGNWYYLNSDGIMQTGWFYDKGYWYYLQGDGSMRVNVWAAYNGQWYFFNSYGQLQTGWTLYLGNWYYLDDHGVMQKGWATYDKNKYYLNDDGTMRTGWLYNGRVWYYLDSTGKMVTGWQTIDGKKYYFDASGAMKTGMMFLDGQWINLNNV